MANAADGKKSTPPSRGCTPSVLADYECQVDAQTDDIVIHYNPIKSGGALQWSWLTIVQAGGTRLSFMLLSLAMSDLGVQNLLFVMELAQCCDAHAPKIIP